VEKSVRQSDQQVRCSSRVTRQRSKEKKSRFRFWLDHTPGLLALASREANVDAPCRHLRIFLFPDKVNLGCSDIRVTGKLAHLVQSTVTMYLR
jgi:hypothetical protein